MTEKNKGGRPSLYSEELAELICERLANGESLRAICREDGMPSMTTVMTWADDNQGGFRSRYACAREAQAEDMDGRILAVAEETTPENAQAQKVKLEAYRWRASKLAPKRYGDKLDVTSNGKGVNDDIADAIAAGRQRVADHLLAVEMYKILGNAPSEEELKQIEQGEFREVDDGSDLA